MPKLRFQVILLALVWGCTSEGRTFGDAVSAGGSAQTGAAPMGGAPMANGIGGKNAATGGTGGNVGATGGTGGNIGAMGGTGGNIAVAGGTAGPKGPATVNLGAATNFVILSKAGISTIPGSVLTGNIGVSPYDSTALTGFALMADPTAKFATSTQVIGRVYASNYTSPTPANLTKAISDMETAFTNSAGRSTPDFTELATGDIGGKVLVPGLYKWDTGVLITENVKLAGGPNDVWIFQISGGITQASDVKVLLVGGALPKNIFWQTAGAVALGPDSHFEGIILSQSEITLASRAKVNGRLFAQTAVTLDANTVTEPAP